MLTRVFRLSALYGKRKLALVLLLIVLQCLFQVASVAAVFPFLALASDPRFLYSKLGRFALSLIPGTGRSEMLVLTGALAFVLLVIANSLNIANDFVRNRYAHNLGHWLRLRLLNGIARSPYSFFLANHSTVLIKKVANDASEFVNGILLPLFDSLARLLTTIVLIGALLFIDAGVTTLAAFGLGLFHLLVYKLLRNKRAAASRNLNSANRGAASSLEQFFSAIKPIKIAHAENFFIYRYAEHSEAQARLASWIPIYGGLPRSIIEPTVFGAIIGVVALSAARGRDLATALPNLGVMTLAGYRLLPALQLLYGNLTRISSTKYALDEVYDEHLLALRSLCGRMAISNITDSKPPEPLHFQTSIRLQNVSFSYPTAKFPVLDEVSLVIKKNTSVGLMGATGSGKSTLVT